MSEKIGDFEHLALASFNRGLILESRPKRRIEDAVAQSLKALEYSRKTDKKGIQTRIYVSLTRQYAKLGNLGKADYYLKHFKKLPQEIRSSQNQFFVVLTEAVYFAAKKQWEEADKHFQKLFKILETGYFNHAGFNVLCRLNRAWALELQGLLHDARKQEFEIQKAIKKVEKRFAYANLQANLLIQKEVVVGEEFEIRLDLINVSRTLCSVIKVESIIPYEGFNITVYLPIATCKTVFSR